MEDAQGINRRCVLADSNVLKINFEQCSFVRDSKRKTTAGIV